MRTLYLAESALGKEGGEFVDAGATGQTRRAIATGANLVFEIQILVAVHDVQAGVGIALGGEQFIVGAEVLLKHRNLEGDPEGLSVLGGEFALAGVSENDDGVFHPPSGLRDLQQLIQRTGYTGR